MHASKTFLNFKRNRLLLFTGAFLACSISWGAPEKEFHAGEGVTDITPAIGTELAGFHKAPGQERRSERVRQAASARALVVAHGEDQFAIVSLDVCAVSQEFCGNIKREIALETGIPADHIRIAATHTHSMPTLRHLVQWGRLPEDYREFVGRRTVEAVKLARKDLGAATLFLGKAIVLGGSHNRTSLPYKTEDQFNEHSTDAERWLDRTLHALFFARKGGKRNLLWYQFSAHPVCYADEASGPDFPGLVASKMTAQTGLSPSFLQGHCGDVNSGRSGRGNAEAVSDAVVKALQEAMENRRPVNVTRIRQSTGVFHAPLDLERHQKQLEEYRADPAQCVNGPWVDAVFAREWHEIASRWDMSRSSYATPISALQLGDVAMLFHPGELYSVYGPMLRRDSPFRDTIVVGYVDDLIGYLPDPQAYERGEYAALVVPKILSLPCFQPHVGRALTADGLDLLRKLEKAR